MIVSGPAWENLSLNGSVGDVGDHIVSVDVVKRDPT